MKIVNINMDNDVEMRLNVMNTLLQMVPFNKFKFDVISTKMFFFDFISQVLSINRTKV